MPKKKFIDSILGADGEEDASPPENSYKNDDSDDELHLRDQVSQGDDTEEVEERPIRREVVKEVIREVPAPVPQTNTKLIDELVRSNISLEKISIELLEAVSKLSTRMDRMLSLFEEAAKNIDKVENLQEQPLQQQLGQLLDQNKVIARGLVLIEKYIRERGGQGFSASSFEPKKLPTNNF